MRPFLLGSLSMACAVASLFFLRYWKIAQDRFFVYFAIAFAVMGLNWIGLVLSDPTDERHYYLYVLRLVAFALIIAGIIDKNRRVGRR